MAVRGGVGGSGGQEEQPDFLPMFPWYSGTSADMYKTMFDLLISVKLFLGRFDLRDMQVNPYLHSQFTHTSCTLST